MPDSNGRCASHGTKVAANTRIAVSGMSASVRDAELSSGVYTCMYIGEPHADGDYPYRVCLRAIIL